MNQNQVEIVHLQEKKFIGIPVTSSFQNHDPKRVEATKESFLNRKHEIKNVINSHEYVCPHFSSEVLFTYFFCMEVSSLEDIPEGMIGFTAPPHSYATTRTEKDKSILTLQTMDLKTIQGLLHSRFIDLKILNGQEKQMYSFQLSIKKVQEES